MICTQFSKLLNSFYLVVNKHYPVLHSFFEANNFFCASTCFVASRHYAFLVQWDEGKFTVWDDSFENELHNESGTAQVLYCWVAEVV